MRETVAVVLLPKSPRPKRGRVGREYWQDWYRGCVKAVALATEHNAQILVASAFKADGIPEAEFYQEVLEGIDATDIVVIKEGLETIGQLDAAFKAATGKNLIVVSSILHFPRVRRLCRGKGVQHKVVWGIPRPSEAIADIFLTFLFPIIDLFGWRGRFQRWSIRRRVAGKI